MGRVTCGRHNVICCWGCDRCPKCQPETGGIGRGDYCADCRKRLTAKGLVWSAYFANYVPPEDAARYEPQTALPIPTTAAFGILPGLEQTVAKEAQSAALVKTEDLEREMNTPKSIDETAGKLETLSPLFRGTAASRQKELF